MPRDRSAPAQLPPPARETPDALGVLGQTVCRILQESLGVPLARIVVWSDPPDASLETDPAARAFLRLCLQRDLLPRGGLAIADLAEGPHRRRALDTGDRPLLRFFAGVPIVTSSGTTVGVLAVADDVPCEGSAVQLDLLRDMAAIVAEAVAQSELIGSQAEEIARQHETIAAVQHSRDSLRVLVDHSTDLIVRRSLIGERTIVSPSCLGVLGYTPEAFLTRSSKTLLHPDHYEAHRCERSALRTGEIEQGLSVVQVRHGLGHWVWLEVRSRLVRDHRGAPVEIVSISHDVSERVEALEAMQVGQARYGALTDALPQMVWVISNDEELDATYTNAQFRAFYGPIGAQREERLRRNHPDDAGAMARCWSEAVAAGRAFVMEGRLRRHDGVYRWHRIAMSPVHRNGMIAEWIGTALDIDDIVSARDALSRTTDLLRLAQESAGAGLWEWDIHSSAVRHSAASAHLHDVDAVETDAVDGSKLMTLEDWQSHVHPADLPLIRTNVERAIQSRTTYSAEFRIVDRDGIQRRWLQAFGRIVFDVTTGEPLRIVGLHFDVTGRKEAQEALRHSEGRLRESESRLAMALDSGDEGLWDWDLTTGSLWVSDRWHTMLGFEPGEMAPSPQMWRRHLHPEDAPRVLRQFRQHLQGLTSTFESEHRVRTRSGAVIWMLTRGRVVSRSENGRAKRIVGTQFEITRRKIAEARIEHMALHDELTSLPNRTLFRDHLDRRFDRNRQGSGFAILCLDLDRFKEINDTMGHPAGDILLRVTAGRLASVVGEGDTIARLGGDEFVIICTVTGADEAGRMALRIIEAVGQPFSLEGRPADIGVSIGIALGGRDGQDADTLFKNADIALYEAKAAGRNTFRFYETGLDMALAARKRLQLDLAGALGRLEFEVHYQPMMGGSEDAIVGLEALLRWRHPTLGLLAPGDFVPLAEENGLMAPIGAWSLTEACREAAHWPLPLRVAVNVSSAQFRRSGLEEIVMLALSRSGLAADRLDLEITETVLLQDREAVVACLHRLRALGVHVVLDDFGAGFSSLNTLRTFAFDKIKIDRCFVHEIDDPDTAAIVGAIAALGQRLGATISAEGVETVEQRAALRDAGCLEAQGSLFGPPVPAMSVAAMLARGPIVASVAPGPSSPDCGVPLAQAGGSDARAAASVAASTATTVGPAVQTRDARTGLPGNSGATAAA